MVSCQKCHISVRDPPHPHPHHMHRFSFLVPLGRIYPNEPEHWLRLAATPDDIEFLDLMKQHEANWDALEMLTELCKEKGWTESELGQYLTVELAELDEWEE